MRETFLKASETDVWNRRCRIPATTRPRADLLRTKLNRSAKRRDQLDDVRSGRFSARSARTRIFVTARGGPDTRTHGFKKCLVRKWQLAKYRSVSVNHLTSPPLSRLLAPSVNPELAVSRVRLPRLHRCTCSRVQLARPSLVASVTLAVPLSVLSCCQRRGEPRLRDLDAVLRHPYCYRSRSDNRWKASPTRTPPPICTSAPCLQPRWSEIVGAASN